DYFCQSADSSGSQSIF
nr:immunoglobulin light chain junction region [Macaca mulatta]